MGMMHPGHIIIIIAGRYKGKRVIYLKNLRSSILVTGPYQINSVPTRKINQAYVLASKFKIDLSTISSLVQSYPYRKKEWTVGKLISTIISHFPPLRDYLSCSFTLQASMKPHLIQI